MRIPSAIAASAGVNGPGIQTSSSQSSRTRGNVAERGSLARGRPIPFD